MAQQHDDHDNEVYNGSFPSLHHEKELLSLVERYTIGEIANSLKIVKDLMATHQAEITALTKMSDERVKVVTDELIRRHEEDYPGDECANHETYYDSDYPEINKIFENHYGYVEPDYDRWPFGDDICVEPEAEYANYSDQNLVCDDTFN